MKGSRLWVVLGLCAALAACGGGSGSSTDTTSAPPPQQNPVTQGSTTGTQVIASPAANTVAISVAAAPAAASVVVANVPFVSVTVCVPGTASCATIDKIQIDTGSSGFRVLSSALTTALSSMPGALPATAPPPGASGSQLGECMVFADGVAFGSIRTADLSIGSEKASSINIEVIGDPAAVQPPTASGGSSGGAGTPQSQVDFCASANNASQNTPQDLHANGVLGIGVSPSDCSACSSGLNISPMYYGCTSGTCQPILNTPMAVSFQVSNPVVKLPVDNNGVIVELPSVPDAGAPSANGMLVFGIGTQTNNTLGNAQVMTTDSTGNLTTIFEGIRYSKSFFDSGSNSLFFPSSIPICTDATGFYCPTSNQSLTAMMQGTNGVNATIDFSIGNTDTLSNSGNVAFSNQGASSTAFFPQGNTFDWGLPAFFGRNVFTAIAGQSTTAGAGPYYAF